MSEIGTDNSKKLALEGLGGVVDTGWYRNSCKSDSILSCNYCYSYSINS